MSVYVLAPNVDNETIIIDNNNALAIKSSVLSSKQNLVYLQTTAPSNPEDKDLWINNSDITVVKHSGETTTSHTNYVSNESFARYTGTQTRITSMNFYKAIGVGCSIDSTGYTDSSSVLHPFADLTDSYVESEVTAGNLEIFQKSDWGHLASEEAFGKKESDVYEYKSSWTIVINPLVFNASGYTDEMSQTHTWAELVPEVVSNWISAEYVDQDASFSEMTFAKYSTAQEVDLFDYVSTFTEEEAENYALYVFDSTAWKAIASGGSGGSSVVVIDNLNTQDHDNALSANMGWTLNLNKIDKADVLPTAGSDYEGKIYLYTGATSTYTNGYFYKCVSDGQATPTYSWTQLDVMPTIKNTATGTDSVTLFGTACASNNSVNIGVGSVGGIGSVAIGKDANAGADGSVQLGAGTNGHTNTLQVGDKQLFDIQNGKVFYDTLSDKFSTMPTASVDYLDKIYQYIGVTDANYTKGHFYQGVSDGATPATYSWEQVSVDNIPVIVDNLTTQSGSNGLSANQGYILKGLIDSLSGGVNVEVVATQPASPTLNTIYYVGTAVPYDVYLYNSTGWVSLGTTSVDLSGYIKYTDTQNNLTSTDTQKPLSANQGKVLKGLVDGKVNKSGDTMSGGITFSTGNAIGSSSNASSINIYGGKISDSVNSGASLQLNGTSLGTENGCFILRAYSNSTTYSLIGKPDGDLLWHGLRVLTTADSGSFLTSSGGDMYGSWIYSFKNRDYVTKSINDTQQLIFAGATTENAGATLFLNGKDYTSGSLGGGGFSIKATDGSNTNSLTGKADGTLTWGGNKLMPVKKMTVTGTLTSSDAQMPKLGTNIIPLSVGEVKQNNTRKSGKYNFYRNTSGVFRLVYRNWNNDNIMFATGDEFSVVLYYMDAI